MEGPIEVPDLRDGDLRLRVMSERDVPAVARICRDPEIQHWTRVPSPYDEDDARDYLQFCRSGLEDGSGAHLLALGPDGGVRGAVGMSFDRHDRAGEAGYWVAAGARRSGVASRATRLLLHWAFRDLGLERCTLHAAVPNEASNAVARTLGFTHEGVLRSAFLVGPRDARYRADANVWGLLPGELR